MYRFTFDNAEAKMNRDFRLKKRDYFDLGQEESLALEKEMKELAEKKDENFGTNENDMRLLWEAVHKHRMETSYNADYCVKSIVSNRMTPKPLLDKIKEEKLPKEEKENK
ncbi:uncharacterized protein [Halyomorpha halys]|uniref:uncharacterized protein n=1 Tax=Halyomorpha halys TaxID=286706 RepID=UPI0006D4F989|nr:uncharacterized protein LOC106682423 [Halyomorpha halys]